MKHLKQLITLFAIIGFIAGCSEDHRKVSSSNSDEKNFSEENDSDSSEETEENHDAQTNSSTEENDSASSEETEESHDAQTNSKKDRLSNIQLRSLIAERTASIMSSDKSDDSDSRYIKECEDVTDRLNKATIIPILSSLIGFDGAIYSKIPKISLIDDLDGWLTIGTDYVTKITNSEGVIMLIGDPENSRSILKKISNFEGVLVVCNMNVRDVSDFEGVILVVNGDIRNVEDSKGVVRVVNGDIRTVSNYKGYVNAPDGKISFARNVEGVIKDSKGSGILAEWLARIFGSTRIR